VYSLSAAIADRLVEAVPAGFRLQHGFVLGVEGQL
jgi:hypothetical protein